MILSPAAADAIFYQFNARYTVAYEDTETFFGEIATDMPSVGRENRYVWLDRLPQMREWVGDRVINSAADREFTVINKDYEDTVKVPRNMIEDDQVGVFGPIVDMLGMQAKILPDRLITTLLANGHSNLCFDGQFFFDTDHPVDIDNPAKYPVQSNFFAGKPLTQLNYAYVRSQMRLLKGADNNPLVIKPDTLLVGPDLEDIARQILTAEMVPGTITEGAVSGAAAKSNIWVGSAKLIVADYLTTAGEWYLIDGSKPVKPFARQVRRAPELVPLVSPTDNNVFFRKELIYGVDSREAMGYGLWFLAAKATT